MCGLCGAGGAERDWFTVGIPDTAAGRLNAWRRLSAAADSQARLFGLRIAPDPTGRCLTVRSASGAFQIATGLTSLLDVIRRLAGKPLDPLAPHIPETSTGAAGRLLIPEKTTWERVGLWLGALVTARPAHHLEGWLDTPNGSVQVHAHDGHVEAHLGQAGRTPGLSFRTPAATAGQLRRSLLAWV